MLERNLHLLRGDFDPESYRRLVERFYGFYRPWEDQLRPYVLKFLPNFYPEREKTPNLEADINALGGDVRRIELCSELPPVGGLAQLFGNLYVSEGATLGGQLIVRHLGRPAALPEGKGTAFFSGYGVESGSMWRRFQDLLIEKVPHQDEDDLVSAARETFRSIRNWMSFDGVAHDDDA